MASDLVVPVVLIEDVRPHPNADRLELATVLGYQVVVPKGKYIDGDKVVYLPADVLVPKKWAERFRVAEYLHGKDKNRVGKVRLRGEPSFGIVVEIPYDMDEPSIGDNLASYLGCEKYQPPVRATAGDSAPYDDNIDPYAQRYTDIQNGRIFMGTFMPGEVVAATEKIHGTNCKVGVINGVDFAGSMGVRRKRPVDANGNSSYLRSEEMKKNIYWSPFALGSVRNLLNTLAEEYSSVILYGEVYGSKIQGGFGYGVDSPFGISFRAFDLCVDGKYKDHDDFRCLCENFGVPVVPVLYEGPFDIAEINKVADGKSTLPGSDNIREGVVVRPIKERSDPKIGRVILKFIGTMYELGKKDAEDFTDV